MKAGSSQQRDEVSVGVETSVGWVEFGDEDVDRCPIQTDDGGSSFELGRVDCENDLLGSVGEGTGPTPWRNRKSAMTRAFALVIWCRRTEGHDLNGSAADSMDVVIIGLIS